jgi:hypothetical protein
VDESISTRKSNATSDVFLTNRSATTCQRRSRSMLSRNNFSLISSFARPSALHANDKKAMFHPDAICAQNINATIGDSAIR